MAKQVTCLIVEDDDVIRSALAKGLERTNYRCLQAASGEEALEVIAREVPEVMISDLRMPGMDGVALLEGVKQHWPDVAVVVATAVAEV
ncbi:MAG: response regulator, partial [Gemmatimonadales bacterium]